MVCVISCGCILFKIVNYFLYSMFISFFIPEDHHIVFSSFDKGSIKIASRKEDHQIMLKYFSYANVQIILWLHFFMFYCISNGESWKGGVITVAISDFALFSWKPISCVSTFSLNFRNNATDYIPMFWFVGHISVCSGLFVFLN